jgi:hypothetical protein
MSQQRNKADRVHFEREHHKAASGARAAMRNEWLDCKYLCKYSHPASSVRARCRTRRTAHCQPANCHTATSLPSPLLQHCVVCGGSKQQQLCVCLRPGAAAARGGPGVREDGREEKRRRGIGGNASRYDPTPPLNDVSGRKSRHF